MADLQAILAHFFRLLNERQIAACRALLDEARAAEQSDRSWLDYLQAILHVEQAPPRWDLAQETLRSILTANPPADLRARVHLELGFAADYLGDYAEATEQDRLSLALFEALGDRVYQGKVLRNTGVVHLRAFERKQAPDGPAALTEAQRCFERSLAIFLALGDEQLIANAELHLGIVAGFFGRWEDALARYTARAEKCRRFGWQRSLALTLNDMGEAYYHLGRWQPANDCYTEALALLAALVAADNRAADPYEEADIQANLALALWAGGDEPAGRAASNRAIRLVEEVRDPLAAEAPRIGFFGTRIRIYEQRIGHDVACDRAEAALSMLERAKSRAFIELLAGRASNAPDAAERASFNRVDPLDASALRERLPGDTLLIEYFVGADHACVFLVTHQAVEVVPLVDDLAARLERAFGPEGRWLNRLGPDAAGVLHFPSMLPRLYQLLIAPIADRLTLWRRLCIVPHGALHYVPFHALFASGPELARSETGQSRKGPLWAGEAPPRPLLGGDYGPEIVYAPSATVLLDYCQGKPMGRGRGGLVVSHGDDLPHLQPEAAAVAARLGGAWHAGAAATCETVLRDSPRYPVLHFACHGSFDPAEPLRSGLDLADGRLTAAEILEHLRLEADLVALSGCETGQSLIHRGDELIGLTRAFIAAGTPSILVSLWPVADISTRLLMERFYDRLLAGTAPSVALAAAQRCLMRLSTPELRARLLADGWAVETAEAEITRLRVCAGVSGPTKPDDERLFAHPYYWAPFILIGARLA
jgi:tetratricopeptide (TPR) repeat protein